MCKVTKLGDGRKVIIREVDSHVVKVDGALVTVDGVLVTGGSVAIMKKPSASAFHREYLREHGLAMYRGLETCDVDRLLDNMLEAVEVVE